MFISLIQLGCIECAVAQLGITESRSFDSYAGTGLAVLTSSHQFFVVNSVEDPKVWRTPEIPRKAEKPSCWTIVSKGRKTKVIAVFGADIFALTQGLPAEQIVSSVSTLVNRYVRIAVSQDQSKLALLSENGLVQFTSVDMKQTFSETTIDLSDSLPVEFLWCGNEALAVLENDTSLTLLGIDGGSIRFAFDEAIRFGAEVDGIRLFSHSMLEFIAKVPDSVCAVYQVASNEPGALLLEASGKYKEGSHQAYDYLRMVGDRLQQAVEQCVAAAGHEFDIASQRALIEAAAFGKTFARDMNAQSFVDMCRVLRVL
uniref:Vps16 N-terminal domain-containing protein n=1 Tax=Plectus sambesii TaxID=2011161 RepID=A0A914XPM3_9BILA